MAERKEENKNRTVAIREEIKKEIKALNPDRIRSYEPQNQELKSFVIDCSQVFASLYDSLRNMLTEEELRRFDNRISSIQHSPTNRFLSDLSELSENRRKLNEALNSCASKLDKGFLLTNAGRFFVSFLELIDNIDSAFDKKCSQYLIKEAYKYSFYLGLTSHVVFGCISVSEYLGFIPEFWDIVYSQWVLRDLMKATQNDTTSLERVQQWFLETEEMEEEVRELFSYGLDNSFVNEIDRIYRDHDTCTKVFATVFISSLQTNNSILNDIKSLSEMFLFSRCVAGKEWYNRALKMNHPVNFIKKKFDCREKMMALARTAPEIPINFVQILPKIEISAIQTNDSNSDKKPEFKLKLKPIPFFILGMMNMFSIYSSCRILFNREKHLHSDSLRLLSQKATQSMREIDTFLRKINKDRRKSSIEKPLNI